MAPRRRDGRAILSTGLFIAGASGVSVPTVASLTPGDCQNSCSGLMCPVGYETLIDYSACNCVCVPGAPGGDPAPPDAEEPLGHDPFTGDSNRLLLFTNVFGADYWKSLHLPLFLKSVKQAPSIDVLFVGSPAPPDWLIFPPNAKFSTLDPDRTLMDLENFIGLGPLRASSEYDPYKLGCELKPLIPALYFDKLFSDHTWFGWMDNDMLVSGKALDEFTVNLRTCHASIVPMLYLEEQTTSAMADQSRPHLSYGPLTLFRAQAFKNLVIPNLRSRAHVLHDVWHRTYYSQFDEWGMTTDRRIHDERIGSDHNHTDRYNHTDHLITDPALMTDEEAYRQSMSSVLYEVLQNHGDTFKMPDQVDSTGCRNVAHFRDRRYPNTYPGTQLDDGTENATLCEFKVISGRGELYGNDEWPAAFCHFHHRKSQLPLSEPMPKGLGQTGYIKIVTGLAWGQGSGGPSMLKAQGKAMPAPMAAPVGKNETGTGGTGGKKKTTDGGHGGHDARGL